jgi:hypothetical protein
MFKSFIKKEEKRMNFLNIKKGAKMNFIVGEHRNEFEQEVIDSYLNNEEGGFWGIIPSLERSILPQLNPKFFLAGILGKINDDPSFYVKETHGKMLPEFERYWAAEMMNRLLETNDEYAKATRLGVGLDTISVLDYHHMFYMVKLDNDGHGGTGIQGLKNIPMDQVW